MQLKRKDNLTCLKNDLGMWCKFSNKKSEAKSHITTAGSGT